MAGLPPDAGTGLLGWETTDWQYVQFEVEAPMAIAPFAAYGDQRLNWAQGPAPSQINDMVRQDLLLHQQVFAASRCDEIPTATAEIRGWRLLRNNLDAVQRQQLDARKTFDVIGSETGLHYRISIGRTYNVGVIDVQGVVVDNICFVPAGNLCVGDVMLTQKLGLELRELEMLRLANSTTGYIHTYNGKQGTRIRRPPPLEVARENVRQALRAAALRERQEQLYGTLTYTTNATDTRPRGFWGSLFGGLF